MYHLGCYNTCYTLEYGNYGNRLGNINLANSRELVVNIAVDFHSSFCAAAACAVASMAWPKWATPLRIGYVASLATKLSDTFASEIGKASAMIVTFKNSEVLYAFTYVPLAVDEL